MTTTTTKKLSGAGAFAYAFGKTTLGAGLPGVVLDDDGAHATLSHRGVPYAVVVLDVDAVAVSLRVASLDREWALRNGYVADAQRAGWFTIRLGRAAREWLSCNAGGLAGRAMAELRGE